ncbi:hypothetical protein CCH79_00007561 [Gambusia affinis]|uniref:Uncharacterized protein n=1 Tax=Gambusia affinis TaxID=33528 RepID=A0A315WCQ7_GAMAF|nr:hypothetical protein CCH79_00007561 [Gambusia affinis]
MQHSTFGSEAGCMRCMRVGSIDTARRVQKRSRYCKSAITFRAVEQENKEATCANHNKSNNTQSRRTGRRDERKADRFH